MRTKSRGFTLLEVLVAIAVFAVFSTLAYGSLSRLLDSRDRIETERALWRELALAITQIEDDLGAARPRKVRDLYGNFTPATAAFVGQPSDTRVLGNPAMEFTRGGVFVLGDSARPDLVRVGYRLREGNLQRITWPALDLPTRSEPQFTTLLENVTELRVRFYAPAGGWVDVWPPTGQLNAIPKAVEMNLTIDGRGSFQRILRVGG
jgi:general secretion pathway protein J